MRDFTTLHNRLNDFIFILGQIDKDDKDRFKIELRDKNQLIFKTKSRDIKLYIDDEVINCLVRNYNANFLSVDIPYREIGLDEIKIKVKSSNLMIVSFDSYKLIIRKVDNVNESNI